MSATFAYEDPLSRTWAQDNMNTRQKTTQIFKDMGKGMWKSGKGFGKVGALYAGVECCIEGVRDCLFAVRHTTYNISPSTLSVQSKERHDERGRSRLRLWWCSRSCIGSKSSTWRRSCFCRVLCCYRSLHSERNIRVRCPAYGFLHALLIEARLHSDD